jgi:radical SAM protein with 4Fe4S-binding SPASM domain
MSDETLD